MNVGKRKNVQWVIERVGKEWRQEVMRVQMGVNWKRVAEFEQLEMAA